MRLPGQVLFVSSLCLLTVLSASESYAGFERRYAGARSLGTAGALGLFGEDAWSFYANPARAASLSEVGLFYTPTTLGLQEIRSMGAAFRDHVFGLDCSGAIQSFGYELYRETVLSAGASLPVSDFLFVGSNLNLNHLYISDYGTDLSASIDIGGRMFLSEHVAAGFSMTNLNSASMTLSNDRLPQSFAAGIAYLSGAFNLGIEYFKELGFPSSARIAAEYSPASPVTLRAGTSSGSSSFSAGFSVRLAPFRIEYGAAFHQVLGTTHSFGLSLELDGAGETEFDDIQRYRESIRRR